MFTFDTNILTRARARRKDESTFILEIFALGYILRCTAGGEGGGAARCRRTNDLMREGLETPDTVAANREMREGKRDTRDGRECERETEKIRPARRPGMNPLMQRNTDGTSSDGVGKGRVACRTFHRHHDLSLSYSFSISGYP